MSRTRGLRDLLGSLDGVLRSVEAVADALDGLDLDSEIDLEDLLRGGAGRETERTRALRVLGFGPDARPTLGEIRSAYRAAARREHPDAGGSPERFAAVAAARDTLERALAGTACRT